MWNETYFEGPAFDELLARIENLAQRIPEDWTLRYARQGFQTILLDFDFPGTPQVDPVDDYLSRNYDTVMTATPGSVKCQSIAEAHYFLALVEERIAQENPAVDYELVLKTAQALHREAYDSEAGKYTDSGAESLPCRGTDVPYWMEFTGWKRDADLLLTADWSTIYCHWNDIPLPDDENEGALLIQHEGESGSESEVELHDLEEYHGIKEGSLEEFLLLQLLVWRGSDGYDRSQTSPQYCFIRYDIVSGIWLRPTAHNVQYLEKAMKTDAFQGYYNDYSYRNEPSDRDVALWAWLEAARKDAVDWENTDAIEQIDAYRAKFRLPNFAVLQA